MQLGYLAGRTRSTPCTRSASRRKGPSKALKRREREVREFRFRTAYSRLQAGGHLRREFEAYTPYYYSAYDDEDESRRTEKRKVMILGGGPNRIGQGIEFDYRCCHASFALREEGGIHNGELQPRDRLHRLRHRRTAFYLSRSRSRTYFTYIEGRTPTASSCSSEARPRCAWRACSRRTACGS